MWSGFLDGLSTASIDVPWAMLYSAEDDHPEGSESTDSATSTPQRTMCRLEGAVGLEDKRDLPTQFNLGDDHLGGPSKALATAFSTAWHTANPLTWTLRLMVFRQNGPSLAQAEVSATPSGEWQLCPSRA